MIKQTATAGALCALALTLMPFDGASAAGKSSGAAKSCDNRVNNTQSKLQQCVTVEGVRRHQAAFQDIADANGDIRTSGTPGYDESAFYVADLMEQAGYEVTLQEFTFTAFIQLGPATLEQIAPLSVVYVEGVDYEVMSQTDAGCAAPRRCRFLNVP